MQLDTAHFTSFFSIPTIPPGAALPGTPSCGIMHSEVVGFAMPILTKNIVSTPSPIKKSSRGFGCLFASLFALGALLTIGVVTILSTIEGPEFSPASFQTRTFSYQRLPGTRILLSKTKLGASTAVCTVEILKHLPPVTASPAWQVASTSTYYDELHGPSVLINALKQRNVEGDDAWGAWSFENPSLAAVLWPLVQQVAFQELYECVPELLETAENTTDPRSLERSTLEIMARTAGQRIRHSTEYSQTEGLLAWLDRLSVTQNENKAWFDKVKAQLRKSSALDKP